MTAGDRGLVARPDERGLLVDFGGVLTTSVARSIRAFEREHDLPKGTVFDIVNEAYAEDRDEHFIVAFERGASTEDEFGAAMAAELRSHGVDLEPGGIAGRLFAGTTVDHAMWKVVGNARSAGVRTALVSNSWGTAGYPLQELEAIFDTLVISGEVGLRKPDPRIFRLAAERLDLEPPSCGFIDDHPANVAAARELGMFAVHHREVDESVRLLAGFLGLTEETLRA